MARVLFKYVFLSFLLLLGRALDAAISPIPFSDSLNGRSIGLNTEILMDPSGALNAVQAEGSAGFHTCMQDVPNLGLSRTAYWVRFTVTNESHSPEIILKVPSAEIERLDLYVLRSGQPELICRTGQAVRPDDRPFMDGEYGMPLNIPLQGTSTYLLRVHGLKQLLLPMHLNTEKGYSQDKDLRSLIAGALFGIFLVMALYNLFLYFSVRDISYLIYVMYILLVCVTQLNFLGYAQLYFWPSATAFALRSSQVLTVLTAAAAGIFMHQFTRASQFAPSSRYLTPAFVALLFGGLGVGYVGLPLLGYKILQISVASFSTYLLTIALICWWRGFRPAAFFSVAWALFLVGITAFVLKDMGLLPYTWLTKYLMPMGSVAEVVLLSFGLADKINVLRREKELSQAEALQTAMEKEQIILDQNVTLERKVNERTQALQESTDHLKRTQSQLVSAEKMASLGQLTAGIAHEINNPLNFISSNIPPLKRDLLDLKEVLEAYRKASTEGLDIRTVHELEERIGVDFTIKEVQDIMGCIEEGAARTSDIVRGLRTFSRLDEDDLKFADINEGIRSTLVVLGRQFHDGLEVQLSLSEMPEVECYPGKLNQVFMNTLNNAAHAVKQRHGRSGGKIEISSRIIEEMVQVTITDNGTGMDQRTQERLFEPFFTTKGVGEGTGLGLSIVQGIIEKHFGQITLKSEMGQGTTFTFKLPLRQDAVMAKRA